MISVYDKKEDCCGCTACEFICPVNAIEMGSDEEGFLYPKINQELCIDCGLCKKVCPIQNKFENIERFVEPKAYAVKHKSNKVRMESTSGGAYTAISDYALNIQSVVYGAKFSEEFYLHHDRAINYNERDKFKGSKYIQSDLQDVFIRIKNDLTDGKGVLFTGTGCQVAGLVNYLVNKKVDTDKLITNDFICHGTPSPLIWNDYLKFIQKREKLVFYSFRSKDKGWHGYNVKTKFKSGKERINTADNRVYTSLYSSNLTLRPSCYNCKFTNLNRPSDIMIGDFWGIENTYPEIDDDIGISLVLVNTPKGKKIFNEIKPDLDFWESSTKDCLQLNLIKPTKRPKNRERFWQDYYNFDFEFIANKYGGYSIKGRIRRKAGIALKKLGLYESIKQLNKREK